ncbi:MAG: hypothetical protein ACJ8F3_17715 [Xanthobacteraceae bacterium]
MFTAEDLEKAGIIFGSDEAAAVGAQLKQEFEGGDKSAILAAIYMAAERRTTLPEWAADAFMEAYEDADEHCHKTWDAVFGSPPGKVGHSLHLKNRLQWWVWARVKELRRASPRKDPFPQVGKEFARFCVGQETLRKTYYQEANRTAYSPDIKLIDVRLMADGVEAALRTADGVEAIMDAPEHETPRLHAFMRLTRDLVPRLNGKIPQPAEVQVALSRFWKASSPLMAGKAIKEIYPDGRNFCG